MAEAKKVRVHVTLKPDILDPQGEAVCRALASLGFEQLRSVRIGKLIELEIDAEDAETARTQARSMCESLLANPVMEKFIIEPSRDQAAS